MYAGEATLEVQQANNYPVTTQTLPWQQVGMMWPQNKGSTVPDGDLSHTTTNHYTVKFKANATLIWVISVSRLVGNVALFLHNKHTV